MKNSLAALAVTLLVILVSVPGEAQFGKNKIAYDEFDWQIYPSTHFDIYFYEEERDALQKIVNYAESAYDELSRKFDHQIEKRIPLIYYATHSDFEQTNVIIGFIPEGVGAFAEPVRNRMVLPIDLPDEKIYALIKHELTHIFEYEIFFQGRIARRIRANPPTWLMEGLASFMAEDEDTTDLMVLRDAVVNDQLPSISQSFGGFFAYRFGHAVFAFMEDNWGMEGVRDFIYEYRNTLGVNLARPIRQAFDLEVEEFDTKFRTWLRKRYLPALISKGEPLEYGERVRIKPTGQGASPAPAPSGDLMAALTTYKNDMDIVLLNVPKRSLLKNITSGFPDQYEYIIAQFFTTAPLMGRDLAFSPDGDRIAVFVRKENGRHLMIVDALGGRIERMVPMPQIEQQLNPAFSPDATRVAFHGFVGNQADIFVYDLRTGAITNLTNDSFFDAAPTWSPDGRNIVYSSVLDGYSKLVRIEVESPSRRYVLTRGDWNDRDAHYTPDGTRVFFASDRPTSRDEEVIALDLLQEAASEARHDKALPEPDLEAFASFNIYSYDLATGEVLQYTDVIGGSFTPAPFIGEDGEEKFAFASYYKGGWDIWIGSTADSLGVAETIDIPVEPLLAEDREEFLPPVEVNLDPEKVEKTGGFRLFVDDVSVSGGVTSDQTFVSRSVLTMSDMLGGRRFIAALDSVSTFSNFNFAYYDLRRRWNWGTRIFDNRTFYVVQDLNRNELDRRELYRITGADAFLSYPFDRSRRVDFGVGYLFRELTLPFSIDGAPVSIDDDFPYVSASLVGDSTIYQQFGPVEGRRYALNFAHLFDTQESGTLSDDITLDFRQYLQLSRRTLLAARIFAGYSEGNRPNFYYFGGLNTLRGYDFRTIVGNRAFYGNFEIRFPLIDVIQTPVIALYNVRGSIFFDVGGAYFSPVQDFEFYSDGKLQDGLASVGFGLSVNLFGLPLNWDFAKRTDLDSFDGDLETSFWIGTNF